MAEREEQIAEGQTLGSGAAEYRGLDSPERGEQSSQALLNKLAGNAEAAGISEMAEIIRDASDRVKLETAELALELAKFLSGPDAGKVEPGRLIAPAFTGDSRSPKVGYGDDEYEAMAKAVYALVGAERPEIDPEAAPDGPGRTKSWSAPSSIDGIEVTEHRHDDWDPINRKPTQSWYINYGSA